MKARRLLIGLIVGLVVAYGALLLFLRVIEDRLVFFPERGATTPPPGIGTPVSEVALTAEDGVRLSAWEIPAPGSDWWLLILHGNAGNLATPGRPQHDRQLHRLGFNILALDYRGYGGSEGVPTEQGLYADARAGYDYLRRHGVPVDRLVIYGHSLGSAVAVDLASRVPAAGLIVEGSFTSAVDMGQEIYPFVPVRLIARNRFAAIDKIGRVTVPKLFIHGRDDATIPIRQGRRLFEAAPEPRTFLEVAGGHDDAFEQGAMEYERGIAAFLVALGRPAR